jgi:hypothetical protein
VVTQPSRAAVVAVAVNLPGQVENLTQHPFVVQVPRIAATTNFHDLETWLDNFANATTL